MSPHDVMTLISSLCAGTRQRAACLWTVLQDSRPLTGLMRSWWQCWTVWELVWTGEFVSAGFFSWLAVNRSCYCIDVSSLCWEASQHALLKSAHVLALVLLLFFSPVWCSTKFPVSSSITIITIVFVIYRVVVRECRTWFVSRSIWKCSG